jgi:hypothetical protein
MIANTRREILSKLARIGELDPDVRFGQLIANLATMAGGASDQSLWDIEDEQLLGALNELIDMLSNRRVDAIPEAIAG